MTARSSESRTALIVGISGQDGSYLAEHLLGLGYRVVGTSRDAATSRFEGLRRLSIKDRVELLSMSLTDFRSTMQVISRVQPNEVYNLAGQTSVGLSFEQPVETFDSIIVGTVNLLETIRMVDDSIRLYNAGSSEMFGNTDGEPATEDTIVRPRSPYAIAKATSYWQVAQYREAYGIYAATGILFNHESPLRPERFVTQKVVAAACRIATGEQEKVTLGDLSIARDWGWAPEYVVAMQRMLATAEPEDYVIATGHTASLEEFVAETFAALGLEWRSHVEFDESLRRPTEIACGRADPSKAKAKLDWLASVRMPDVAYRMVNAYMH